MLATSWLLEVLSINLHNEICKYEMEMPDINLAHADLNKYNQAPNYLANQVKYI